MKKSLLSFLLMFSCYGIINSQAIKYEWVSVSGNTGSGDKLNTIVSDKEGNVYTTGYFSGDLIFRINGKDTTVTASGGTDMIFQKIDSEGNIKWVKTFGGLSKQTHSLSFANAIDDKGYIYVTGRFRAEIKLGDGLKITPKDVSDILVAKLDPNTGKVLKYTSLGSSSTYECYSIAIDKQSNIYLSGNYKGTISVATPNGLVSSTSVVSTADFYLLKLDSLMNPQWLQTIGENTYNDVGFDIDFAENGDVYTVGLISSKMLIQKLDTDGDLLWRQIYTESSTSYAKALEISSKGDLYVTGYYTGTMDFNAGGGVNVHSSVGGDDAFVLKLDGDGSYIWSKSFGGTSSDKGLDLILDNNGQIVLYGDFWLSCNFQTVSGLVTIKSEVATDGYILKMDTLNGDILWVDHLSSTMFFVGSSLAKGLSQSVYLAGGFSGATDFGSVSDLITSKGGDDVFVLKLSPCNLRRPSTDIYVDENLFVALEDGAKYQWFTCNHNLSPIVGATNQYFFNEVTGDYALQVSKKGCVDTSFCFNNIVLGFLSNNIEKNIYGYPNPVVDYLTISAGNQGVSSVKIFDFMGTELIETQKLDGIDLSEFKKGIYIVKLITEDLQENSFKIVKD